MHKNKSVRSRNLSPFSGFHSLWLTYSTDLAGVSIMNLDDIHKSFKYFMWHSYFANNTEASHMHFSSLFFILYHFSPMAQHLLVGQGVIIEASRSISDTLHSVGVLFTSDRPVAETST